MDSAKKTAKTPEQILGKLKKELQLSDATAQAVLPIISARKTKIDGIRGGELKGDDLKAAVKAVRAEESAAMKTVLTEQQYNEYVALLAKRKESNEKVKAKKAKGGKKNKAQAGVAKGGNPRANKRAEGNKGKGANAKNAAAKQAKKAN